MLLLLVAHALLALAAPALVSWLGRRAFLVMAVAPAAAAVYALSWTSRVMSGDEPTEVVSWIPVLGVNLAFRMVPARRRMHPRARAGVDIAAGRQPANSPLAETPDRNLPPLGRRNNPRHYVPGR